MITKNSDFVSNNANVLLDVLKKTHEKQKFSIEQKNKSSFDFDFQCEYKSWKCDLSIF